VIPIKNQQEIQLMKTAGEIGAKALQAALKATVPGVTLLHINQVAEDLILANGATPGFKTVAGYNFATCININDGVVHGMPNNSVVKEGDLITIDLGARFEGYHSDTASTKFVGNAVDPLFLETGKKALQAAINACTLGNRLGDVSFAMQHVVESAGFSVSRDLVGHGIGIELHEEPQIPCYGKKAKGPLLKEGMVFAIEVIYQKGKPGLALAADGWTLETADGSLAGLFEHTVAITAAGPEVLTCTD